MKMTIIKKIVAIAILVVLGIVMFGQNVCYAEVTPINKEKKEYTLSEAIQQAIDFIIHGKQNTPVEVEDIKAANDAMFNLLVLIGTALAVIIGGILGIQFMVASVEDKAKIKEAFIPYIIGCVLIFGAFGIWKLVVEVLSVINSV